MGLFHSIIILLKNKKMANGDSESYNHFLLLNFLLLVSFSTSLIFSVVHILFFEFFFGYVLFAFFIVLLILFICFRMSLNYRLFSTLTIVIVISLFSLITLLGAGNKSGDRKSTRLNSSHTDISRMPSSA